MIEIISHCWRYSKALCYQLSSLYTWSDPDMVKITVCYSEEDRKTAEMLTWFDGLIGKQLQTCELTPEMLLRRSIGRNIVARDSFADIVWFCDCDYYFGQECLATLGDMILEDDTIYHPHEILANNTREIGDKYSNRVDGPVIARIDDKDFFPVMAKKAIGGLQIVSGDLARKGYLGDHKRMQKPVNNRLWQRTSGDVRYRKLHGDTAIYLPNLYRIRQSVQGQCD